MGRAVRFAQPIFFCIATLLMVAGTMRAQDALQVPEPSTPRFGGPQDWSDQHVIYTRNGSAEDMLKLRDNPRFLNSIVLHYMREHRNQLGQPGIAADLPELQPPAAWHPTQYLPFPNSGKRRKVDWAVSLGPTAGMAIGETPAVYVYNYASPSCNDFVVYTVNAPATIGNPGQANLIGLKNLYTNGAGTGFCAGTNPSLLFSYAIGTGGSPLSPVISLDGTKVAWIENRTSTASYLHITNWVANQGTSATWPVGVTGAWLNGTCNPVITSCDYAVEYTASTYPGCATAYIAGNGHSDLYVDYPSNSGFISANNGLLYHIKNIFSTTASPTVDFCIPVNSSFETVPSSAMSGPIYDEKLNEVFITDSEKIYGYTVNASSLPPSFVPAGSYTYGNSASNYNYQTGPGPLLDWFNGFIYVFSAYDANSKTSVTQLPTSLASGVPVELGPISTNANQLLFYGAFDNNYYTYGPAYGTNPASTLYSCGTDSTTTTAQDLFAISFNASTGVVNATPAMSYNTNVNPGGTNGLCSPITEFYDGTTDRIFVGMGQPAAATGANVVTMWNVTTQLTNTSGTGGTMPTPVVTTPTSYLGGTSGISADNNASGTAQAQSIYFSTEEFGTASTGATRAGFNVNGIYTDGSTFSNTGGLDDDGNAYSSNLLGTTLTWNGTTFTFGTTNVADVWANTTITLPTGSFSTLEILGTAVNGNQASQTFTVTYSDNSTTTLTQSVSDWFTPQDYAGETIVKSMAYRNMYNGTKDNRTFDLYGYSFGINPNKTVKSLTLPATRNVCVLAVALSSNCGGKDYCAVKLTQTALQ
jgi:hypothetical protein